MWEGPRLRPELPTFEDSRIHLAEGTGFTDEHKVVKNGINQAGTRSWDGVSLGL